VDATLLSPLPPLRQSYELRPSGPAAAL